MAAVGIPFTVKFRMGWNDANIVCVELARMAEDCGLNAVALHARTREDGYTGQARWEWIAAVKDAVGIPVIGNGDIRTPQQVPAAASLHRYERAQLAPSHDPGIQQPDPVFQDVSSEHRLAEAHRLVTVDYFEQLTFTSCLKDTFFEQRTPLPGGASSGERGVVVSGGSKHQQENQQNDSVVEHLTCVAVIRFSQGLSQLQAIKPG